MDSGVFLLFLALFSLLMLFVQRSEAKRRVAVFLLMLIPGVLLRNLAVYRDVEQEAWAAFFTALILNFLFWVLIGRYNPVASSDSIRVLGMDD
ncbi:MAG: hypothetical protein OHK0046_06990 [Anaerolineae bacterium]